MTYTDYMCQEKKGGRGLASIEDSVDVSVQGLEVYNTSTDRKTTKMEKLKWKGKSLYRYFKRQTDNITHEKTCTWLREGNLKRKKLNLCKTRHD